VARDLNDILREQGGDAVRNAIDEALLFSKGGHGEATGHMEGAGASKVAADLLASADFSAAPDSTGAVLSYASAPPAGRRSVISGSGDAADGWQRDASGKTLVNEANFRHALKLAKIAITFDEFSLEERLEGLEGYGPLLDDAAMNALYLELWGKFGLKYNDRDLTAIISAEAHRNRTHPAREYFEGLKWDGVERLNTWLPTYLGAEQNDANEFVGPAILIAAVRRVRKPGVKFDSMLVLEGPENAGKSLAVCTLCRYPEWFTDNVSFRDCGKDLMDKTAGKMLVEMAELVGLNKADIEGVKATLSRQVDEDRLSYAKRATKRPRQFIFVATTNESAYLLGTTGNRRFWPVRVAKIDLEALKRDRDQLWAEAAHREAKGEAIHPNEATFNALKSIQAEREIHDEWEGPVQEWLDRNIPRSGRGVAEQKTTLAKVAYSALAIEAGRFDSTLQHRMKRVMIRLGWRFSHQSNGNRWWTPQQGIE
jgi:predicted P-loop ATPase